MCDMICLRALSDCTDTLTVHIPFKIARNTNDKNVVGVKIKITELYILNV